MDLSYVNIFYALYFIAFFDLFVLGWLVYYYRRFNYNYLKFGAVALFAELISQTLFFSNQLVPHLGTPTAIGGIFKMLNAAFLMVCAANMVDQKAPLRTFLAVMIGYLLVSVPITVSDSFQVWQWYLAELPAAVALASAIYLLVRFNDRRMSSHYWVVGLLVVHLVIKLSLPALSDSSSAFPFMYFFNTIILMLIGATLIMTTAERMLFDLRNQTARLNHYEAENRRLEMQYAQSQKMESLGVMAGGIAHDFNNMLTSVLGYASLALKKLPGNSEVRDDLFMVMSGARQAVDLTSQMLLYAGKGVIEFQSVSLPRVVDDIQELLDSIIPRKVQLKKNIARDIPQIKADAEQLSQVVVNLVANGVDAIGDEQGVVQVTTGLREVRSDLVATSYFASELREGAYVFISVRDSGTGIDPELLDKIFDPFFTDKNMRKGLGLSSLSGIVRQHGGFIHVDSTPGQGSEFVVYFPAVSYEETEDTVGPGETRIGENPRVLLADDDARIRTLLTAVLEAEGYQLTVVEDGQQAMQAIETEDYDYSLYLLDCTMPRMLGTEVYREIRRNGRSTPVVLISGYHQDQVINNIQSDSHACFIKKPFNVDNLTETVRKMLLDEEPGVSLPG